MPLQVGFLGDAIVEARAGFLWYRKHSVVAAKRFRDELLLSIDKIVDSPHAWPPYSHGTRRYLLRRFPFFVVYRVRGEEIEIVAVVHDRRRPGYWERR